MAGTAPPTTLPEAPDAGAPAEVVPTEAPAAGLGGAAPPITVRSVGTPPPEPVTGGCSAAPGGAALLLTLLLGLRRKVEHG